VHSGQGTDTGVLPVIDRVPSFGFIHRLRGTENVAFFFQEILQLVRKTPLKHATQSGPSYGPSIALLVAEKTKPDKSSGKNYRRGRLGK
jgi:hypothetical protein